MSENNVVIKAHNEISIELHKGNVLIKERMFRDEDSNPCVLFHPNYLDDVIKSLIKIRDEVNHGK